MNDSFVNGTMKFSGAINTGMFAAIAVVLITMWSDIRQLKRDQEQRVSPSDIAVIKQIGFDHERRMGAIEHEQEAMRLEIRENSRYRREQQAK